MDLCILNRSSVFVSFVIFVYCGVLSLFVFAGAFCFGFSSVFVIFVVFPYCEPRFRQVPVMPQVRLVPALPVEVIEWRAAYREVLEARIK